MTRTALAATALALTLAGCGTRQPEPAARTVAPAASKPALTVSDTATLTNGDTAVILTVTLTCTAGHTAFGSAAVTDNTNASDTTQPQGYSGVLRIPCTGQPQTLTLTLTTLRVPFRPGPALARAAFTLNQCDDSGCPWNSVTKPITNVR
jgi:hypothetical protein